MTGRGLPHRPPPRRLALAVALALAAWALACAVERLAKAGIVP